MASVEGAEVLAQWIVPHCIFLDFKTLVQPLEDLYEIGTHVKMEK